MTVECSFVCACNSSEFCLSGVSSEVSKYVFHGQTQVFFFHKKGILEMFCIRASCVVMA